MSERLSVVYDGQCGFCRRTLRVMRAIDVTGVMEPHDAHDSQRPDRLQRALAAADLNDAMFVVDPAGLAHRGFFGFRRLARSMPALWPLLPVLYFPGSALVGPRVYSWIARHRHSFGCETDSCEVPNSRPSPPVPQ